MAFRSIIGRESIYLKILNLIIFPKFEKISFVSISAIIGLE